MKMTEPDGGRDSGPLQDSEVRAVLGDETPGGTPVNGFSDSTNSWEPPTPSPDPSGPDSGDSRSASVVDKLGWLRDLASRESVSLTRGQVQYVLRAYDGLTSLIALLEQARLDREAFRNALEYEKSLSKEFSARARVRLSLARGVMQDADDGNLPVPGLVAYFEQANEEMDAEWHAQGMEP